MTNEAVRKIDGLLEEANAAVQDSVAKYRPVSDTFRMVPVIGGIGHFTQGYQVGKELGHPVAGTIFGAEGAAGALSKNDKSVSIGDVYTRKNMVKRGLQGAVFGAGTGAANSALMQKYLKENPAERANLERMADDVSLSGIKAEDKLFAADHPLEYAGEEGLDYAIGGALLYPGIKYGLGKVFGRRHKATEQK